MAKYTKQSLANAIDWEGGIIDLVIDYGLDIDELPDDTPEYVIEAFLNIKKIDQDIETINEWLPEPGEED